MNELGIAAVLLTVLLRCKVQEQFLKWSTGK